VKARFRELLTKIDSKYGSSSAASSAATSNERLVRSDGSRPASAPQITNKKSGYANGMRHIEVHVIESETDVATALSSGLLEVTDLDGDVQCNHCSDGVAYVDGEFVAFAVAIDELDEPWFVCLVCSEPVVEAEDTGSTFVDLFIADEELDDFDLEDDN